MSTNKNALLRFNTLDRCFRNFGRQYSFDDLLHEVNTALEDDNSGTSGIQVRQLRDDIKFMRSESGYQAPIKTYNGGGKPYYRYADRDFSISGSPLNETEAQQLKNAISILHRFEGSPQFEWVNEISAVLTDRFGMKDSNSKAMAFDTNIDYSGYRFITPMFNAIVNRRVMSVNYAPFDKEPFTLTFHPYFLKQYNNRWFVFGYNEEIEIPTWNLALDRIVDTKETNVIYKSDSTDWEDYFFDIIGVTRPEGEPIEVELHFAAQQAPYVQTKPLHPSQKAKLLEDGSLNIRLHLIPNFELQTLVLSFGERVRVVSPKELRDIIEHRVAKCANQY